MRHAVRYDIGWDIVELRFHRKAEFCQVFGQQGTFLLGSPRDPFLAHHDPFWVVTRTLRTTDIAVEKN